MSEEKAVYDPYKDSMSDDNPYLDTAATGFVFTTLGSAWMAHWPHVVREPSLAADSFDNAVLGALDLFTDESENAAKGILFEAGRLIASQLDIEPEQALRMKVLGVYDPVQQAMRHDAFVSDSCLYMIEAFLNDDFESVFEDFDGLPSLPAATAAYLVSQNDLLEDIIEGYRILIVTILMMGTRQWVTDEFPEFEGANEDVVDE